MTEYDAKTQQFHADTARYAHVLITLAMVFGILLGAGTIGAVWWLLADYPLVDSTRAAILEHDRDALSAEIDATRHEVESAHVSLGLLCNQPEKSDFPPAAVADEDPAIPSFKTDCAIVWSKLLDKGSGQVKITGYGTARVVSWWPDYPGKRRPRRKR